MTWVKFRKQTTKESYVSGAYDGLCCELANLNVLFLPPLFPSLPPPLFIKKKYVTQAGLKQTPDPPVSTTLPNPFSEKKVLWWPSCPLLQSC